MAPNDTLTAARVESPRPSESPRANKIRLLVADDNLAVLGRVCAFLGDQFEIVAAVPSGEAVLSQYAALMPDLVILDISMGGINGLDVARILRDRGCEFPIIFLTVFTGADAVSAALSSGGSAYVVKPHMRSDLVPAIEAAMSGEVFVSPSAL
jgi:DNA-binding NarL/FixJ family response regulator